MWKNNYRLCRYSLSRNEIEVLTNERIDCFNVGYGYVYYQVNGEEACLKCMRDDGSDSWVIAEGNYTAINMTSQYVYFQMFGDDSSWYHSPLGSQSYSGFDAARQAALDAMKNNVTIQSHEISADVRRMLAFVRASAHISLAKQLV